ncbi:MAG: hypothetical protein ABIF77_15540 [bacterium]
MGFETLHYDVAAVLEEKAVRKIHFHLERLPVTFYHLLRVAAKVKNQAIHIRPVQNLGGSAKYAFAANTIEIDHDFATKLATSYKDVDTYEKSIVVHEAIHAVTDMNFAKNTTIYTNEVAAYLGQTIYLEAQADDYFRIISTIRTGRWAPLMEIHRACQALIRKHNMLKNVVQLRWREYHRLRETIKNHPKYKNRWRDKTTTPADGIPDPPKRQETGGCSMASNAQVRGGQVVRNKIYRS